MLCLQEVSAGYPELPGNQDGGDQFEALAGRLADYAAVSAAAVDVAAAGGGRRTFGNLLLSRLPIGPVWRHLLPYPADPGVKGMQRVALEATLETPLGALRVVTTHLEYYSARQRSAQVERLRELHREAVGHARGRGRRRRRRAVRRAGARRPGGADQGDFNFRPGSAEHARLLAAFRRRHPPWRDAWQLAHPGLPHEPTVGLRDKAQWPEQAGSPAISCSSARISRRGCAICGSTPTPTAPTTSRCCCSWTDDDNRLGGSARRRRQAMNPYDPHRATASPTPSAAVGADPLLPPADAEHEPSPIDLAEQSVAGEEDPGAAYGDEPLWPAGAANGRDTGAPDAGAAPGAATPVRR